jgi:hypothetical protein
VPTIALTHVVTSIVPENFLEVADAGFEPTRGWQSPEPNARPLRQPATNDEYYPKSAEPIAPKRKRERFPGSKNKLKITGTNTTDVFVTQKKRDNAKLAVKLRQKGKIIILGKSFKLLNQTEIDVLIGNEMFRFK